MACFGKLGQVLRGPLCYFGGGACPLALRAYLLLALGVQGSLPGSSAGETRCGTRVPAGLVGGVLDSAGTVPFPAGPKLATM